MIKTMKQGALALALLSSVALRFLPLPLLRTRFMMRAISGVGTR